MSLNLLELRAANKARDAEWVTGGAKLSLSFRGNELAGEIGEACNIIKKLEREKLGLVGSRASVWDLADELADGVICIDLTAMDLGIDLGPTIIRKFNATSQKRGLKTMLTPSQAVADVLAERRRQVEVEGWTADHDDGHDKGEMGAAALNYAAAAVITTCLNGDRYMAGPPLDSMGWAIGWRWAPHWWKPGTVRRMLVKAAALIIAEIERLDRAAARKAGRS